MGSACVLRLVGIVGLTLSLGFWLLGFSGLGFIRRLCGILEELEMDLCLFFGLLSLYR
jgi:hypothetical protein